MPKTAASIAADKAVAALADGLTSSSEIAAATGLNRRHVCKILKRLDLPRLPRHSPTGARNASWNGGRRINQNGYVHVSAPKDHPYARLLPGKKVPRIFEHRLVMEQKLGRYLLPEEKVDHIDGLTLHNHPDNLRLFSSNAEHLKATLTGKVPRWSPEGHVNMTSEGRRAADFQRVDTHRQRTKAGASRLRQILLAALRLGTDSPYLLGSSLHLKKAGIDMSSRSTIERALADLCEKWGWPPPQL